MSARSDGEIKSLVREVEDPFLALCELLRKNQAQLYGQPAYKDDLIDALAPEIDTRVPVPSSRPMTTAAQVQGILRQSLSFHVEPSGKLDRDERRADKRELYYAHEWAMNFNRGGRLLSSTYRYQAVGPFAAWWLDWNAFALPKEQGKREEYRKAYSPFRLSVLPPATVAFLTDVNGEPTIATRRFKLPYVDIARLYGEGGEKGGKDSDPLKILGEQFGYLRGGSGRSPDSIDLTRKSAEIFVVDDNSTICHYIDIKDGDGHYRQVGANGTGKDYPNPWGSSSLIIVTGAYNPDAKNMEDRYLGLIADNLRAQRNLDVIDTHIASIELSMKKHGQRVSDEIAKAAILEDKTIPDVILSADGWVNLVGDYVEIGTSVTPVVSEIRQRLMEDRDATLPSPFLTNPDQALIKGTTATGQLAAHETSNQIYDSARESLIAGVVSVCKKIDCFVLGGGLPNKGAASKEVLYFKPTGKEPTKKYAGNRKGEELEYGPEDIDEADVLEVTPVPRSESQKQLRYAMKKQQVVDGVQTPSDLIAEITEDVTGTEERLEEWRRYQQLAPIIDNLDFLDAIAVIRDKYGRDYSQLALNAGLMPGGGQPASNGAVPTPQPVDGNVGGQRMDAPAMASPDVEAFG